MAMAWSGIKRRLNDTGCVELAQRKHEQFDRIFAAEFGPVGLADRWLVQPVRAFAYILERGVDREHHAVGAHDGHGIDERGGVEISRRGEMKVLAEIMSDTVLGGVFVRRLHPSVPVVDAPEIDGYPFADVAEHDFQSWMFIEKAAADQTQCMDRGFRRKGPVRPE